MKEIESPANLLRVDIPSFKVDCRKYISPILSFSGKKGKMLLEMKDIKDLSEYAVETKEAVIRIRFPFRNDYDTKVISKNPNLTKKEVIDFVRDIFVNCYRNLPSFPCDIESKETTNELYELTYPINCLYVEDVFFDKISNLITLNVSGNPIVRKEPDYPF